MGRMGLIRAAAILAIDNRFRTPSVAFKCFGASFGAHKQKFSISRDSTWPLCDLGLWQRWVFRYSSLIWSRIYINNKKQIVRTTPGKTELFYWNYFSYRNIVRQGCILSPYLHKIYVADVMRTSELGWEGQVRHSNRRTQHQKPAVCRWHYYAMQPSRQDLLDLLKLVKKKRLAKTKIMV